jgi:hypothetical protein
MQEKQIDCSMLKPYSKGCDGMPLPQHRRQSCTTSPFSPEEQDQLRAAKEMITAEQASADRMGITIERLRQLRAYAETLHKKYPHMSEERVQRKAAEYFKIKLT